MNDRVLCHLSILNWIRSNLSTSLIKCKWLKTLMFYTEMFNYDEKGYTCVTTNCSCFIVKEKWLLYEMPCSAETSRCSYYFFFILQYICHRYYSCPCFLQSFDITTLSTLATWISSLGNITNSWTNYLSENILAPHWMLTIRFLSD